MEQERVTINVKPYGTRRVNIDRPHYQMQVPLTNNGQEVEAWFVIRCSCGDEHIVRLVPCAGGAYIYVWDDTTGRYMMDWVHE
jgi:hypothetical protein